MCAMSVFSPFVYSQIEKYIYSSKLSEEYVKISTIESVYTRSIAYLDRASSITEIFVDGNNNAHFGYFDSYIGVPIYVVAPIKGEYQKHIIDKEKGRGHLLSMAIDKKFFNINTAYLDEKNNSLWYSANNRFTFNNYPADLRENIDIKKINLLVSAFRDPVAFFIDKRGSLSVARIYRGNFFSEFIYTNRKLENIYAFAEDDGYAMYLQEKESGNIFYASRKTNTKFAFFDTVAIVTNAFLYSVKQYSHNRFTVVYTDKNKQEDIYIKTFTDGKFENSLIKTADSKVISLATAFIYDFDTTILYITENKTMHLFKEGLTFDMSFLGEVSGDISFINAMYPYFYFLYYSETFNELKLGVLNISDVFERKMR